MAPPVEVMTKLEPLSKSILPLEKEISPEPEKVVVAPAVKSKSLEALPATRFENSLNK